MLEQRRRPIGRLTGLRRRVEKVAQRAIALILLPSLVDFDTRRERFGVDQLIAQFAGERDLIEVAAAVIGVAEIADRAIEYGRQRARVLDRARARHVDVFHLERVARAARPEHDGRAQCAQQPEAWRRRHLTRRG